METIELHVHVHVLSKVLPRLVGGGHSALKTAVVTIIMGGLYYVSNSSDLTTSEMSLQLFSGQRSFFTCLDLPLHHLGGKSERRNFMERAFFST